MKKNHFGQLSLKWSLYALLNNDVAKEPGPRRGRVEICLKKEYNQRFFLLNNLGNTMFAEHYTCMMSIAHV